MQLRSGMWQVLQTPLTASSKVSERVISCSEQLRGRPHPSEAPQAALLRHVGGLADPTHNTLSERVSSCTEQLRGRSHPSEALKQLISLFVPTQGSCAAGE